MSQALYILAELSDRDFDWILSAGRRKEISAGTVLIQEGEIISALYIVLDGTLGVFVEVLEGSELARISAGEVVGEMSFVDSRPPSATVKAIEDTVVWSIPRSQLAAKLGQDTAFAAHFYQALAVALSDRLRGTVNRLGSHRDHLPAPDPGSEVNPDTLGRFELARARFDWLLKRLRDAH